MEDGIQAAVGLYRCLTFYLDRPRLALLGRDGRQRPAAGERRHGGNCGGELRPRHHQVELGQLGGVAGDVSLAQRCWRVLGVVLKEEDSSGSPSPYRSRLGCSGDGAHVQQGGLSGVPALQPPDPGWPAGVVKQRLV